MGHYLDYKQNHINLSMPRQNRVANLSSFENCLAQYLECFEGLGKINNVHIKVIHLILSMGL